MADHFSVFVADDHPLFRSAMVAAVKSVPDLELVGEAADGRQALDAIREAPPDVCVLDMRMPELDGLQVLQAIVRDEIPTRVLFVAAAADAREVYDAISSGAAGYLDKSAGADEVTDAIRTVARGNTFVGADLEHGVIEQIKTRGTAKGPALSQRELEVLRLIGQGLSARQTGEKLFVEESTIKSHLKNIYEKLGVSGRAAAIAEAMRRGLLE